MSLEYQTFFPDYLSRLENLQKDLKQVIDGLPQVAIDWIPAAEMNSIAVLMAHTTGSLRYWIGDVALGDPSGRVRETEFKTLGVSGEELLARLEEVLSFVRKSLPRLSLEDLGNPRPARDGETRTCAWALLHALEHAYLHLGHIQITRQLWEEKKNMSR